MWFFRSLLYFIAKSYERNYETNDLKEDIMLVLYYICVYEYSYEHCKFESNIVSLLSFCVKTIELTLINFDKGAVGMCM